MTGIDVARRRGPERGSGKPTGLWASQMTQVRHPPLQSTTPVGGRLATCLCPADSGVATPQLFRFQEPGSAHSSCQGVGTALQEAQASSSTSWWPDTHRQPGLPARAAPEPHEGPIALGPSPPVLQPQTSPPVLQPRPRQLPAYHIFLHSSVNSFRLF